MGYAEKNLTAGESVVYRARYHWWIYRTSLLVLLLAILLGAASFYAKRTSAEAGIARPVGWLALAFLGLSIVTFLARRVRAAPDEFVVTNRRVIRRVGMVSREIEQAPIEKIQDITVEQGALARLLDFGTVVLETASERGTLLFPLIAHPEGFRNAIWGQAPAPAPAAAAPAGGAVPAGGSVNRPLPSTRERLAELENLRQQGLVSNEEYAAKRREILSTL